MSNATANPIRPQTTGSPAPSSRRGLNAAFRVLPHEDQDEFDILLACLQDELAPVGEHETFLVEQMAQARWKIRRMQRLETAVLDRMMSGDAPNTSADPDDRIVSSLLSGEKALTILQRYTAAAERSYYRAHTELRRSRQMRKEAKTVDDIDAAVVRRLAAAPVPRPKTRVLQNEPKSAPRFFTAPGENLALRL